MPQVLCDDTHQYRCSLDMYAAQKRARCQHRRNHAQPPLLCYVQAAIQPSPAQKAAMIMAFQDMVTSTQALFPSQPASLRTELDGAAGPAALASDAIPVRPL